MGASMGARKNRSSEAVRPPWTDDDTAIWHTLDILAAMLSGRASARPPLATPFPPHLAPGELILVEGPFLLSSFYATSDGSSTQSTMFVAGTGAFGAAAVVTSLVGSALVNASREKAARAAATPAWRPCDSGTVYVSTRGFYLQTNTGLYPWDWSSVSSATVVGRSRVNIQGDSRQDAVSWILQSPWAELIFTLWAVARHPTHPQIVTGGWLPPGWYEHAKANGYWPERQIHEITAAVHERRE